MAKQKAPQQYAIDPDAPTQRLSAMFSINEKEGLEEICAEKRWSMATLIREAIEVRYPKVFKASRKSLE